MLVAVNEPVEHRRRRRHRIKLKPRFWALLGALLLLYMGAAFTVGFVKIMQVRNEIAAAEVRLLEVLEENEALREQVQYYLSHEYVERMARTQLGLVMPGETAVVVVTPENDRDEEPDGAIER